MVPVQILPWPAALLFAHEADAVTATCLATLESEFQRQDAVVLLRTGVCGSSLIDASWGFLQSGEAARPVFIRVVDAETAKRAGQNIPSTSTGQSGCTLERIDRVLAGAVSAIAGEEGARADAGAVALVSAALWTNVRRGAAAQKLCAAGVVMGPGAYVEARGGSGADALERVGLRRVANPVSPSPQQSSSPLVPLSRRVSPIIAEQVEVEWAADAHIKILQSDVESAVQSFVAREEPYAEIGDVFAVPLRRDGAARVRGPNDTAPPPLTLHESVCVRVRSGRGVIHAVQSRVTLGASSKGFPFPPLARLGAAIAAVARRGASASGAARRTCAYLAGSGHALARLAAIATVRRDVILGIAGRDRFTGMLVARAVADRAGMALAEARTPRDVLKMVEKRGHGVAAIVGGDIDAADLAILRRRNTNGVVFVVASGVADGPEGLFGAVGLLGVRESIGSGGGAAAAPPPLPIASAVDHWCLLSPPGDDERRRIASIALDKDLECVMCGEIARETRGMGAIVVYAAAQQAQVSSALAHPEAGTTGGDANSTAHAAALAARRAAGGSSLVSDIPRASWDDVGGLEDAKRTVYETITLPALLPDAFRGLERRGILLYGPPGTGKTLVARAVASESRCRFFSVKGPELLNMYVGESERNVREVFARAREESPAIVFFDEIDALAPRRGEGSGGGVADRIVAQLLCELDRGDGVFVIAATNRPDLLDPALLRPGRLDARVYVGMQSDALPALRALTRRFTLAPDVRLEDIAVKCGARFTGADLYGICAAAWRRAAMREVERVRSLGSGGAAAEEEEEDSDAQVTVTHGDFATALETVQPSVSAKDMLRFEAMREKFSAKPSTT